MKSLRKHWCLILQVIRNLHLGRLRTPGGKDESKREGPKVRHSPSPVGSWATPVAHAQGGETSFAVTAVGTNSASSPTELVFSARHVAGRATPCGEVQSCRWVAPDVAVRMLWPLRAEQLRGALTNRAPQPVVIAEAAGPARRLSAAASGAVGSSEIGACDPGECRCG
jgi:hypothetical protein